MIGKLEITALLVSTTTYVSGTLLGAYIILGEMPNFVI